MICPPAYRRPLQGRTHGSDHSSSCDFHLTHRRRLSRPVQSERRDACQQPRSSSCCWNDPSPVFSRLAQLPGPTCDAVRSELGSTVRPTCGSGNHSRNHRERGSFHCQQPLLPQHICQPGRGLWHRRYRSPRTRCGGSLLLRQLDFPVRSGDAVAHQSVTRSDSKRRCRIAPSSHPVSFREKFVQGLRFIRGSKFLIQLVIVGLVVNFFGAGVFALLAPYAKNVIGGNAGTYGVILTTYSVGAVIGSVLVGKLQLRNYVGKMLFAGVIGQGLVIVGIGFTTVLFLALALSFAIGVLQTMVNVPITVLVQTRVPGDMLGRVFSSLVALLTIVAPVSSALAGGLATSISIGGTFQVFGGLIVLACTMGYLFFRDLRDASY